MRKQYVLGALFAGAFLTLIALFAFGLTVNPNALDLATKDKKISAFALPALLTDSTLTNADLKTDKGYYLINFWGSWCTECYKEHPYLLLLGERETLFGVNWKDERSAAVQFIQRGTNPYKAIMVDDKSVLAIDMGVYGAPETFLVKADGTIIHRYAGPLNEQVWKREFIPQIKTLVKD